MIKKQYKQLVDEYLFMDTEQQNKVKEIEYVTVSEVLQRVQKLNIYGSSEVLDDLIKELKQNKFFYNAPC